MAISELSCSKAWGGLFCMNGLRKQSFGLGGPPFLASCFSLNHLYRQSLAKTVNSKSLLMNGCGLSPKFILDGCKNSWVNFFEHENPVHSVTL